MFGFSILKSPFSFTDIKTVTIPTICSVLLPKNKSIYDPRIFPNFQNCVRCEKDLKDNKDNSLHLGRKYARIFVLGHYLFLVTHSFPRASFSENCSLLGTDNVRGQISEHIFAPNGDYCLFIEYCYNRLVMNNAESFVKLFYIQSKEILVLKEIS